MIQDLTRRARTLAEGDAMVREVRLFGSLATERHAPGSDADLLVVLEEDPRPFLDRVSHYLPLLQVRSIPVDVFPYTQAEIERMLSSGNLFLKRALAESVRLA